MTARPLYAACGACTVLAAPLAYTDAVSAVALWTLALLCLLAGLTLSQRAHDELDPVMRRMATQLDAMGAEREAEMLWRRDLRRAQLLADVLRMRELARAEREHVPSVSGVRAVVHTASEIHEATLPGRPCKRGTK